MTVHAPETPFGCAHTWGVEILRGVPLHVCNREEGHEGRHVCRCGAWAPEVTA